MTPKPRLPPLRRREREKVRDLLKHMNVEMKVVSSMCRAHVVALALGMLLAQLRSEGRLAKDFEQLLAMIREEARAVAESKSRVAPFSPHRNNPKWRRPVQNVKNCTNDDPIMPPPAAVRYMGGIVSASTLTKYRMQPGLGPRFIKLGKRVGYRRSALDEWLSTRERSSTLDSKHEVRAV